VRAHERRVPQRPQYAGAARFRRVLAPGDASPVSDDPHDQALITDGALLPVETGKTTKKES
jgi:hypothetical protein